MQLSPTQTTPRAMTESSRIPWPRPNPPRLDSAPVLNFVVPRCPTILVVEDDPQVRGMARRVLSGQAYRVLEAPNGLAALAVAEAEEGAIDLVLTDIEMPTIGARRMLRKLGEANADLRVLFMSGHTDYELLRRGFDIGSDAFLKKPFTGSQLVAAVRQAFTDTFAQKV
jgi:two-component system cell cycle sensor histidine kinase/response regulator CckA